jgi:hypothetical protein
MIDPSFERLDRPEGSAGGDWAEELESLADDGPLRRYRDTREAAAFAAMVHMHQQIIPRAWLRLARNLQDAEDVAQTVFLVLAE